MSRVKTATINWSCPRIISSRTTYIASSIPFVLCYIASAIMNKIILTFLIGILFQESLATNEAGANKTVSELSPKLVERLSSYKTSIRFWDTNNEDTKKDILTQLATLSEEFKIPGCPKIRYPMICDDEGNILENICYFRMKRRERPLVLPIMIFTSTDIGDARSMCDKEVQKP